MNMTKKTLFNLGFEEKIDVFTGENIFVLGEQIINVCGKQEKLPIIYYNINDNCCKTIQSEYSIVIRICKTKEEIEKFINAVSFLFELKISIK